MKVLFCGWTILALLFSSSVSLHACGDSPPPYFDAPSYIDPDYNSAGQGYGLRIKFKKILRQYVVLEQKPGVDNDVAARELSEQHEEALYESYMIGAKHFQYAMYDSAYSVFALLNGLGVTDTGSQSVAQGEKDYSWVREASSYMVARCQFVLAQRNWDGYYEPSRIVDQQMLRSADSSYQEYLRKYPDGMYANSARNISRRINYLSGRQALLDQQLKQSMLELFPGSEEFVTGRSVDEARINELAIYFHGEIDFAHDSPMMLAWSLLGNRMPTVAELTALEIREVDFAAYPRLFRYLRALGYYRLKLYQNLLDNTREEINGRDILWLSTELLRARSLISIGDSTGAARILERMHKVSQEDALDVEIAVLALNRGDGLWLFTANSPNVNLKNAWAFATYALTDAELEKGITLNEITGAKRQILVKELARRYLLSSRLKQFSELLDKEQVPELAPAKQFATELVDNLSNVDALVGMGVFLYDNSINPSSSVERSVRDLWLSGALPYLISRCRPCSTFSARADAYTSPISFFLSAVDVSKRTGKKSESEAKALHYIVRSGRSGYSWLYRSTWAAPRYNDGSLERSREAFIRLHKRYKESPWAAATPYYYR